MGTYAITASGGAATNYAFAYADGELDITQAPLHVALQDPAPRRYQGESNPAFDLTYAGLKLGQRPTDLQDPGGVRTPATQSSRTGLYPIEFVGGFDKNYRFVFTQPLGALYVGGPAFLPPTVENARDYGVTERTGVLQAEQAFLPVHIDLVTEDGTEIFEGEAPR